MELFLETESEYRAVLVLKGDGLKPEVGDTDPQVTDKKPLDHVSTTYEKSKTANIAKDLFAQIMEILKDELKNC